MGAKGFAVLVSVISTVAFVDITPASAAPHNDGFAVRSSNVTAACNPDYYSGAAEYVDWDESTGNDDIIYIYDNCYDARSIKAWAWLNGVCLQSCNGRVLTSGAGTRTTWDPFPGGNVRPRQSVRLKVCTVYGSGSSPYGCELREITSVDG